MGTPDDPVLDCISELDDVIHVTATIWIIDKEKLCNHMIVFNQLLATIFDRFGCVLESKSALPEFTVLKECEKMDSVKVHGGMGPAVK